MKYSKPDLGLVLLHALPFDPEMWWQQKSIFPDKTYSPNLYLLGKDIQSWAKQVLAQVREPKLIVVGCSVGGSCALEIATLAPDRIAALVLIGTKARHDPDPRLFQDCVNLLKNKGVEAAWETYWEPLLSSVSQRKKARSIALQQTADNLINGLSAFHTRPSREEALVNWDFPIHVVTGEEDQFPGVNYSRAMVDCVKHGKLHVIKSAGHYLPITNANVLNTLILNVADDCTHQNQ